MRLINTTTGLFEEFIGRNIPKYAILSHTWEDEEVSFKDMRDSSCHQKKGYKKIEATCRMAAEAGINYAWVDTCAIDKFSSAELTEAINSMYQWYQRAEVCYVHLSDLPASAPLNTDLRKCRWFTRGWTLQELVAPKDVQFFDQDWNHRGSKTNLVSILSHITTINPAILLHKQRLSSIAVAQRMSWAARRETTRIEDMAYCLLGMFNVNMPLLYGEEEKAFRRLQEEIIKSTSDLSVFAWKRPPTSKPSQLPEARSYCGVLAETPLDFAESTSTVTTPFYAGAEYSVTNNGVKIRVRTLLEKCTAPQNQIYFRYILPLACWDLSSHLLGIGIKMCGHDQFVRENPFALVDVTEQYLLGATRERYLLTELPETYDVSDSVMLQRLSFVAQSRPRALQIKLEPPLNLYDAWPDNRFDYEDQLFFMNDISSFRDDACAFNLSAHVQFRLREDFSDVDIDCKFCAVNWKSSPADRGHWQCTVVDCRPMRDALHEVHSRITAREHNAKEVLSLLVNYKIPKCSSVAIKIPGTESSVLLSFALTEVDDQSICRFRFWRGEFSNTMYKNKDLPDICFGQWNFDPC